MNFTFIADEVICEAGAELNYVVCVCVFLKSVLVAIFH